MKKNIITLLISFIFLTGSYACEICGCGTGNYYLGLLPNFERHFFGLRYQYSSFKTIMHENSDEFSKDVFQTAELWGGINIGKRWQLLAIVPVNFIHQQSDDGVANKTGLGDVVVLGNYKLFEKYSSTKNKKLIAQQLWLGAGVKLATGKFAVDANDEALVALANTQTGTASTDFILSAAYNISVNNFGVNTSARYKMNTSNTDHYYFGNKFSANSLAYYSIKAKHTTITPNAGIAYEHNDASKLNGAKIDMTGGHLVSSVAGLEVGLNKVTLGFNVQVPMAQNFADGQTRNKLKGMVHVTFAL